MSEILLLNSEPLADTQRNLRKVQRTCSTLQERVEELEQALAKYEDRETDGESSEETEPTWDNMDKIYRCSECCWEVVDGTCQNCGEEFALMEESPEESISTHNEALNPDRTCSRRGVTPLREVGPHLVPQRYIGREEEYEQLLSRGATRLMCETFDLQYLPDTGIIAWADQSLFDEFTGNGMKTGDRWRIRLGRNIQLDEEDLDGSMFVEGLLEDAILFPLRPSYLMSPADKWEVIQIQPGVWETRPIFEFGKEMDDAGNSDADSDLDLNGEDEHARIDKALETPSEKDLSNETVLDPGYETSGDSDDEAQSCTLDNEDDMDEGHDPGWSISANLPDAVYPDPYGSDEYDEDDLGGDNGLAVGASDDAGVPFATDDEDIDMMDEDSADSDFDSDESFSGDEAVLTGSYRLPPGWGSHSGMNLYYSL